jgi:hypothetical protein
VALLVGSTVNRSLNLAGLEQPRQTLGGAGPPLKLVQGLLGRDGEGQSVHDSGAFVVVDRRNGFRLQLFEVFVCRAPQYGPESGSRVAWSVNRESVPHRGTPTLGCGVIAS